MKRNYIFYDSRSDHPNMIWSWSELIRESIRSFMMTHFGIRSGITQFPIPNSSPTPNPKSLTSGTLASHHLSAPQNIRVVQFCAVPPWFWRVPHRTFHLCSISSILRHSSSCACTPTKTDQPQTSVSALLAAPYF